MMDFYVKMWSFEHTLYKKQKPQTCYCFLEANKKIRNNKPNKKENIKK